MQLWLEARTTALGSRFMFENDLSPVLKQQQTVGTEYGPVGIDRVWTLARSADIVPCANLCRIVGPHLNKVGLVPSSYDANDFRMNFN